MSDEAKEMFEITGQMFDLQVGGIKCDADGCDYRDDNVSFEDYHEWLNKPCPKCGANLLTEEDFNTVQELVMLAKISNALAETESGRKMLERMSEIAGAPLDFDSLQDSPKVPMRISGDTKGGIKFSVIEE